MHTELWWGNLLENIYCYVQEENARTTLGQIIRENDMSLEMDENGSTSCPMYCLNTNGAETLNSTTGELVQY
jgi:hypothetical protein